MKPHGRLCWLCWAMFMVLPARADEQEAKLDAIVVSGEVPGPGVWKVAKGGHTLWILGTLQPLPKDIKWRSRQVESLIAQSQELVSAGRIDRDIDVGFFEAVKSIPDVHRARHNPNDMALAQVLDAQTYALWTEQRNLYIGRPRYYEQLRPLYAMQKLREEAYEDLGLSSESVVWPAVRKLARKHRLRITEPEVEAEVKIERASQVVRSIADMPLDDRECFRSAITQFPEEIEIRIARANAWATGDLEALAQLVLKRTGVSCEQLMRNAMLATPADSRSASARTFAELAESKQAEWQADLERRWLAAIESALERNSSTFALLPMFDLVSPKGRLALLKERGYQVEAPIAE